MVKLMRILPAFACAALLLSQAAAQPPGKRPVDEPGKVKTKDYSQSSIVVKMMAFNKKKDGKLTKDEVTDERLHRLFDMADTNKDGVVTKEELMALASKMDAEGGQGPGGPGEGGRGGPGGPGGPGGGGPGFPGGPGGPSSGGRGGPGGFGGRGGPGGFPQPGQIMPVNVQENLKLTDAQKKQLAELQKEVDAKLEKILTDDQKKQMKEMRDRGPGGPGGRGPGGPGGPGGGDRPPGGPGGGGQRGPGGPNP